MCTTHANRQDGGGGPRGACICKAGNVLKVTLLIEDVSVYKHVNLFPKMREIKDVKLMWCCCLYRHPAMSKWPVSHKWFFMKLDLIQVWLQDWITGTSLIPLEDYFKATPFWEYSSFCIMSGHKNRSVQLSTPHVTLIRDENSKRAVYKECFHHFFSCCCYFNLLKWIMFTPTFSFLLLISAFQKISYSVFCLWCWMYLKLVRIQ